MASNGFLPFSPEHMIEMDLGIRVSWLARVAKSLGFVSA